MVKVEIDVDENSEFQIKNEQSDEDLSSINQKSLRSRVVRSKLEVGPIPKIKLKKFNIESIKRYQCQTCDKSFRHHKRLWLHREEHPYFSCYVCWRQFPNIELLEKHDEDHPNQLYVCNQDECDKQFNNCRAFVLHKKDDHEIINYIDCSECNKTFHDHEQWDVSKKFKSIISSF